LDLPVECYGQNFQTGTRREMMIKFLVLWTLLVQIPYTPAPQPDGYGNYMWTDDAVYRCTINPQQKYKVFDDSTTAREFIQSMPSNATEIYLFKQIDFSSVTPRLDGILYFNGGR
jgi:hypothetical protein